MSRMSGEERAAFLRAAEVLDREVAREEARLTTPDHPHPWMIPMLGNWLGGLSTAAQVLRDEVMRAELLDAHEAVGGS